MVLKGGDPQFPLCTVLGVFSEHSFLCPDLFDTSSFTTRIIDCFEYNTKSPCVGACVILADFLKFLDQVGMGSVLFSERHHPGYVDERTQRTNKQTNRILRDPLRLKFGSNSSPYIFKIIPSKILPLFFYFLLTNPLPSPR